MKKFRSFRKYSTTVKLGIQEAMEYRIDFLFGLINGSFSVFIQFFLWTAIYGGSDSAVLYNYSYPQMIVYIIMAGILRRITTTDFEYEIADDIREGSLSRFLVQPIGYFPYRVFLFLGRKILQFAVIILLSGVILTTLYFTMGAEFQLVNILATFVVVPLSLLLNCVMFYCISMTAFWLTRSWGVFNGMQVVTMVLSGGVFPLDVFGEPVKAVLMHLPFQFIVYFPLNIICGNTNGSEIIYGIIAQIFWIVVVYLLSRILWRAGMKKYIAAGG
ncbi:MAG: ABC-2 family transporter protein [Oscillospiraceae bacterium]|nr:ABC-2 family transporter protein [Oscillospiraceae bacterium]